MTPEELLAVITELLGHVPDDARYRVVVLVGDPETQLAGAGSTFPPKDVPGFVLAALRIACERAGVTYAGVLRVALERELQRAAKLEFQV